MTEIPRRTLLKMMGATISVAATNSRASTVGPSKTASEKIADYIVDAKFEDLPQAVIKKAKEQIVFFFGRAFEGSTDRKAAHIREVAQGIERQSGGATVIAEPFRLDPSNAAFANCSLMRGSTRDDVIWPAGIHAGVITLPTALAVGEVNRVSGREMLLALVLGYEVLGKLGDVADGWAAPMPRRQTNIFGGYGPITVAGRMLKLDQQHMANALGYAANLGIGIAEGGMMEHYYSFINRNGILATQLAKVGGRAERTTIEGKFGLYRSFFGEISARLPRFIDSLGKDWEILKADQKHYPGTGTNAVAIKLLTDLIEEQALTTDQMLRLDVWIESEPKSRTEVIFRGPFKRPVESYSSMPYALALLLVDGELREERFSADPGTSNLNEKAVADVMQLINVTLDHEEGREYTRYCRLEFHTSDGRKLVREAPGFEFPFPPSVWGKWLQRDGERLLPVEQLRRLEYLIGDLENLDDVSRLMETVVPNNKTNHIRRTE